ncbi:hypothetical protein TNIN_272011 [Trichonephila inaurata madagascariensis]|uniref:Uncharacterized protein n=1 Tax=Trichonephila inaurata madagascariensis TaxID=2747483 RepID=A0A8X6Y2M8_9ARAC|nr:hypothetical protein TNIN_272011 [Trichonephila inaurata madagascariensis]
MKQNLVYGVKLPRDSTTHAKTCLQVPRFHPKSTKTRSNSPHGPIAGDPLLSGRSGIGSSSCYHLRRNLVFLFFILLFQIHGHESNNILKDDYFFNTSGF